MPVLLGGAVVVAICFMTMMSSPSFSAGTSTSSSRHGDIESSSRSSSTIIVGLNGALQKRFMLSSGTSLVPGNVHRAASVHSGVGGKGQDVAMTLHCLQYQHNLRLVQFVGSGVEGDLVSHMLHNMLGPSAASWLTVRTASAMRICTSIVASDVTTELVEPSGAVQEREMEELLDRLRHYQAAAICFMGSMPPGCVPETYAKIYHKVATNNTLCLIDSVIGLGPLLHTIASQPNPGPTILKVNAAELCRLADIETSKAQRETGEGVKIADLVQAIVQFVAKVHSPYARKALTALAITDGAHPAYFAAMPVVAQEDEFRLFQLPIANLHHIDHDDESSDEDDQQQRQSNGLISAAMSGWGQWSSSRSSIASSIVGSSSPSSSALPRRQRESPPILYPIGAGDAVAAGTLAAWKFLSDTASSSSSSSSSSSPVPTQPFMSSGAPAAESSSSSSSTVSQRQRPSCLPESIESVLVGNESPSIRAMLTAFSFGLACGSASCLQEENSVVQIDHVLKLYNREGRPAYLSSHKFTL